MIELEGPLFFASAEQLHNLIDTAIGENARYVILRGTASVRIKLPTGDRRLITFPPWRQHAA